LPVNRRFRISGAEDTGGCEATIVAHVDNYAAIEPDNLAVAEREVAGIDEAIRVRILWVASPEPRPDQA